MVACSSIPVYHYSYSRGYHLRAYVFLVLNIWGVYSHCIAMAGKTYISVYIETLIRGGSNGIVYA